MHGQQNII